MTSPHHYVRKRVSCVFALFLKVTSRNQELLEIRAELLQRAADRNPPPSFPVVTSMRPERDQHRRGLCLAHAFAMNRMDLHVRFVWRVWIDWWHHHHRERRPPAL